MSMKWLYPIGFTPIPLDKIIQPNLTLDDLRSMSVQDGRKMFTVKKKVSREQLIMSTLLALSKENWPEERALREVWYNPIKIFLYKFMDRNVVDAGSPNSNFSHMGSYLVMSGYFSYKDLGVVNYDNKYSLHEEIDLGNCWDDIILFVEKDAAFPHLKPLCDLLNISLISGKGYSKTSFVEVFVDHIKEKEKLGKKYKVFALTDYDPDGFKIGEEFAQKLETMKVKLGGYKRIGINPDQLTQQELDDQKYPISDPSKKKAVIWCPKYALDGTAGKIYGLEIESISAQQGGGQRIRELVLKELLEHLKEEDRLDEIKAPLWENIENEYDCFPVVKEFIKAHKEHGSPDIDSMQAYIEQDEFKQLDEEREITKRFDTLEAELELSRIITAQEDFENNVKVRKVLATQHLRDEIEKLQDQIGDIEDLIETHADIESRPIESEKASYEEEVTEIEDVYDEDITELTETLELSQALYLDQMVDWVSEEKEKRYISESNTIKELSWGLLSGIHLKLCIEGQSLQDLIDQTTRQDEKDVYEYIKSDIEKELSSIMVDFDSVKEDAIDTDKNKDWLLKWF